MDGGEIDPLTFGFKSILDFRGSDAHIIVMISSRQRVYSVRSQWNTVSGICGCTAQRGFQTDTAAFDATLITKLDVPARTSGISAHWPTISLCGLIIFQHGLQDKARETCFFFSRDLLQRY